MQILDQMIFLEMLTYYNLILNEKFLGYSILNTKDMYNMRVPLNYTVEKKCLFFNRCSIQYTFK